MGGKRFGQGKRVFFPAALTVLYLISACVSEKQLPEPVAPAEHRAADHLSAVSRPIARGDFDGALKQLQDLPARSAGSIGGDEALLAMGLISAHYANPKRDYKKALGYFLRVEREYPRSPLVDEAKIWVSVLQAFEKTKQVDIEIEKMKKGMAK